MTTNLIESLKAEAGALAPQLIAWRRDLHTHPELSFQEVRTAGVVADHLRSLGLEVATGIGKTGVVAMIEGHGLRPDAPTVLLRFDMDALPIHEENDVPYRSQNRGVMHACGHDGHTAIGMGVAQLLARHHDRLAGRVKLVFQPAEESSGGARAMIQDGVLDAPTPAAAFGLHLWSRLPLNQVVVQAGPLWAATDRFRLVVRGRGGHGAIPQETVDPIVVASAIVTAWQSIVARNVDPAEAAVISVCSFHSGEVFNVIPEEAVLIGTVRTFSPELHDHVVQRMEAVARGVGQAYGAAAELSVEVCTPATISSAAGAALMHSVAEQVVGPAQITQIRPMMVGEDMAEFLIRAPGCFVLVGASDPEQGWHSPHHSPTFDFDERVLPTGVALLAGAAVEYLQQCAAQ